MQGSTEFNSIIPSKTRFTENICANDRLPFIDDFEIVGTISVNVHATWFPMMVCSVLVACPTSLYQQFSSRKFTDDFNNIVGLASLGEEVYQVSVNCKCLEIENLKQAIPGDAHPSVSVKRKCMYSSLNVALIFPLSG